MNLDTRKCCVEAIRKRYKSADREQKSIILDEFCNTCGYNRKYAIRILTASRKHIDNRGQTGDTKVKFVRAGRKKKYRDDSFVNFIRSVWRATNCICGKRLVATLPLFAPFAQPPLSDKVFALVSTISPATIDRILALFHSQHGKIGLATTKPGSLLKRHIPIKTNQWDERVPGFVEADTVAHGGSSASGSYAFTLNLVDIATGWTIQRALWGKGQRSCHEAIQDIETVLPFRLKGFDSDNGSEFLNYHLMSYFTDRKQPVEYTRSRPYVKNDNAHIEQKNWTHVRQYLGYQRFDHPEIVPLMNDLYSNELYLFTNFFIPSFKLLTKHREGAHVLKTHDKPKTPFQRLLDSQTLTARKRKELIKINRSLNPFQLQLRIVHKVNAILAFAGLNRVHPDSQ